MKIRYGILMSLFLAAVTLAACGGGGGGGGGVTPPPPPPPVDTTDPLFISSPTVSPIASYRQSVASQDPGTINEIFPGQANVWSLDPDFTLVDGFDDQFNFALSLVVGSTGTFQADQVYSELVWYQPVMGAAEGVKVAAVSDGATVFPSIDTVLVTQLLLPSIATVKTGTFVAFLNATSDSRLQQTLTLPAAPVFVTWKESISIEPGSMPGYDPSFRVVLRQTDGTLLTTTPLHANPTNPAPLNQSVRIPDQFAGQTVVLSFEVRSSTFPTSQAWAVIDNVAVRTGTTGPNVVQNGDFESGDLTGWTTNTPAEIQNVTSGSRNLEGLDVRRSFYTVPNKLWGRWVDVFENNTGAAITKTVTYETLLDLANFGNAGCSIIYAPATNALSAWSIVGNRDVGLVFGNAASVNFISNTATDGTCNGNDTIKVTYNISVPAGGRVAIVNFVIMDGTDTGANPANVTVDPATGNITSVNTAARAADIDAEAARIVSNFGTDPQYKAGMTQKQLSAISNF